jgi:large subunit ribosomal protein L19
VKFFSSSIIQNRPFSNSVAPWGLSGLGEYGIIQLRCLVDGAAIYYVRIVYDMNLIESLEKELETNPNIPELRPGDTVRVHARIVEGDRERVQVFQGTIIRLRRGGVNANFTVRRVASHGIGVERTFLLNSPRLEKVEVLRSGHVRRAQLYYLRDRRGKAARLKEKRIT